MIDAGELDLRRLKRACVRVSGCCGGGGEVVEGLITLVCREPGHQGDPEELSNSITVVGREWCYCPSGLKDGHAWEGIEGTTVEALRRTIRPSETRVQEQGAL